MIIVSLFYLGKNVLSNKSYDASDIEVLEGLEPVRKRPGMYIGGTDRNGMHHLFAEVIDNSMDEAVAGFATFIEVNIDLNNKITVFDNGRGIPIDKHPKYPKKSALEEINGKAAKYFNPDNIDDISKVMHKALFQKNLRNILKKRGKSHIKKFDWNKTVNKTIEVVLG